MVAMATMRGVVLCLAMCWGGASAQLGRSGQNITRDVLQELTDAMGRETVRFSVPKSNESAYVAKLDFDMRAMGPLYNCSPLVVDVIAKKEAYPEGIVSVSDGHIDVKPLKQEWRVLLVHYLGPTFVIVVSALVIVVLPLAGLFWCCWCCCRMGRRRRPFDRKYDNWLKGIFSIVLIVLLTAFLFGVVCAFATDSQVESGAAESSDTMRSGLKDVHTFFEATLGWTRVLLIDNYSELENSLSMQHQTSGMRASWKLGAFSRAASVTTLNQMVQDLDSVQHKLRTVQAHTATLRLKAEELNTGLRKVKNQLLQTLAKCDQPKCRALQEKYKIGQLDTEIQYSQMPDVSELLHNVSALLDSGIKQDLAEAQRVFDDVQRSVQRSLDLRHSSIGADALRKIREQLKILSKELEKIIHNADDKLRQYEKFIDQYEELYKKYGPYRRYGALAASCALLLITCLLTLGLMCGVCGKRPDVYGASDCCNKGAGSSYLLCGIGLIFLLGGLVTLVMLAHFVYGLVATRFVCDPLTEPRGNQVFQDVGQMVDLEQSLFKEHKDPNFNLTSVLVACHANSSIYRTLHLWRMLGIKKLRDGLREELAKRSAELEPPPPPSPPAGEPLTILRAPARDKLRQLADIGLSDFDFDRILSALETNMTSLALDPLAAQLNSTARSLQQPLFSAEAASLRLASAALSDLQRDVLRPMMDISAQLNGTARELRDELRFNHSSLKEAITYLVHETSEGEDFLNDMTRRYFPDVKNVAKFFTDNLYKTLDTFLGTLESSFLDKGVHCGPLSNAFNVTRDAFCLKVLLPVHGYWLSLSWCVLLLLPLLLVAGRLARLYRRAEPYPGPLVDAEYLYDAYADRDNVPLANGSKRSTLDIEGKIQEWRTRSAPSAPPAPSPPAPPAPPAATRLLLAGEDVVCQLLPPPELLDDLKTRLDHKDEDNESGIHESDAYKAEKRGARAARDARAPSSRARSARASEAESSAGAPSSAGVTRDSTVAPSTDSYHARRYNDMAPKHWEEGPPRYLGSTEYERPPPYYYPGPHDRP